MSLSSDQRASGSRIACGTGNTERNEFSREERKLLLKLAHDAIRASLEHRELPAPSVSPHLAEPRHHFRLFCRVPSGAVHHPDRIEIRPLFNLA